MLFPAGCHGDALGMATRLKMSGRAAEEAAHDKEAQSAEPGALSSTPAAVPQGPVLHVTQVMHQDLDMSDTMVTFMMHHRFSMPMVQQTCCQFVLHSHA